MQKGLSKEEAEKLIPYGQEDYLTIDELRIKFDYPEMGKSYPQWLEKEDHLKMCFKTAKETWNVRDFGWFCTPDELATKLFIWSSIRLNKFNSYPHLKAGLRNCVKNILRDEVTRETMKIKDSYLSDEELQIRNSTRWNKKRFDSGSYISTSLDQCLYNEYITEGEETLHTKIASSTEEQEELRSVINQIRSIKNKQVKQFLIVGGFLLANINELESDFNSVVEESTYEVKTQLINLYNRTLKYEEMINNHKYNGQPIDKSIKKVEPKNIIDVLGTKSFGDITSTNEVLKQVKEYLINTHFGNLETAM